MFMYYKKVAFCVLVFSALSLAMPGPGFCHRVNIFCWVEGDQVKCEARFTPGGPVKKGQVTVYSQQTGKKLLTTNTDENGTASFKVPGDASKNRWDLKVVCTAEMGHKNFWVVRADEFTSTESGISSSSEEELPKGQDVSDKALEKVFSRILNSQLAPIKRDLAELKEKRITIQDGLGGLGYILGLAGVAFFFLGKKKRQD